MITATESQPPRAAPASLTLVERALKIFAEVKAGEGTTALLLTLNIFLLLLAYYLLKTAREPLILAGGPGAAEVKSYASGGMSILLLAWVPLYGFVAQRVGRVKLISIVTLFFASNLVIFYLLAHTLTGELALGRLGIAFFLWVGIFNVSTIAQFWGFAADIYTPEQGKRLFAILGIGAVIGAAVGAKLASWLFAVLIPEGAKKGSSEGLTAAYTLMLIAAAILVLNLGLTWIVNKRDVASGTSDEGAPAPKTEQPLGKENAFALILKDKYLLLIGALTLVLNCVNSTGEYVLDRTLVAAVAVSGDDPSRFIGTFKGNYFAYVNVIGVVMQLFVVSRVIKYIGIRGALFVMPAISLVGYSTMSVAPILSLIFVAKIAENSMDYSLQNTTRQALWLPTSRDAKYKAKAAIDTLLVRGGDVLSTGLVALGAVFAFGTKTFAVFNVALVLTWLAIVWFLGRTYAERTANVPAGKTSGDAGEKEAAG